MNLTQKKTTVTNKVSQWYQAACLSLIAMFHTAQVHAGGFDVTSVAAVKVQQVFDDNIASIVIISIFILIIMALNARTRGFVFFAFIGLLLIIALGTNATTIGAAISS